MATDNPSRQQFGDRAQGSGSQQGATAGQARAGQGSTSSSAAAGDPTQSGQARSAYGSASQGDRGEWGRQGTPQWRSGMPAQRGGYDAAQYGRGGVYGGYGGGPFALMRRISDEMDRLFEGFGVGGRPLAPEQSGTEPAGAQRATLWSPHLEVCERNGKLLVQMDLPGVRREDVDIDIEPDALVIQGHRHQQNENRGQGYYHSERSYGSFYRRVPLPEGIDTDAAQATFRDGVLEVEMPMPRQAQRGRRLEIREGGNTYAGSASRNAEGTGGATGGSAPGAGSGTGGSTSIGGQQGSSGTP